MPQPEQALEIDFIAETYHYYPGETATFHLRLRPQARLRGEIIVRAYFPHQPHDLKTGFRKLCGPKPCPWLDLGLF